MPTSTVNGPFIKLILTVAHMKFYANIRKISLTSIETASAAAHAAARKSADGGNGAWAARCAPDSLRVRRVAIATRKSY